MLGYAFAVVCSAIALFITLAAEDHLAQTIFAVFTAGTSIVAWYCGIRPAILSVILAVFSVAYFIIAPRGTFGMAASQDVAPLVVFSALGLLIAWLSDMAHRKERRLKRQASNVEDQAVELEQQMEQSQSLQAELEEANAALAEVNAKLKHSREFLEQAQRSAQLGSWEWDIPQNEVAWSDEMFRLYGYEPGSVQVSFETFLQYVHPDDRDIVRQHVEGSLQTQKPFQFEHRLIRPNGDVRWLESRGKVLTDAGGKPVRMTGSGQDITERRRILEAMRMLSESSETLASSLDFTATLGAVANLAVAELADWVSIAIGDETGRHENIVVAHRDPERVAWAKEYNRLHPPRIDTPTGVPQVLRTGKSEFYPDISREMLLASVRSEQEMRIIEELRIRSAMVVPMTARGRTLGAITFIASGSTPRFTKDDLWLAERLAGRAAIAIDNARLFEQAQAARQDAEAANTAKTDFLAAMSHELRTPLNAIAGYAQLLDMEVHGPVTAKQRDALARLQRSQQHLLSLVEEVLGFATLEKGVSRLELEDVPVVETLASACEMIAPQVEAKKLRCKLEDGDASLVARADRARLGQILVNLLANAVKFTPEGGVLQLSADGDDKAVRIIVSDSGIGIPKDKLDAVFEPFVQLLQPRQKRAGGVGLGLSLSRDLARAMGGDISVTSTLGQGSTFTLQLPRAAT